ncbi:hypothetical protein BKA93DRAFT_803087 [Sparassis latifolia]
MSHTASQVVLHIWPSQDSALSFDPSCVAALLYLQLAIPGLFALQYCTNPDLSPSGQLPFLTHGMHNASTLPAIIKYVNHLEGARDLDESLDSLEKAQNTALLAHVQSEYGDLVAHMMYSLNANWWKTTRPALVSILPLPQRYYVPARLRNSHKPRLEFAGLWDVPGIEYEDEDDDHFSFRKIKRSRRASTQEKLKRTFEREKVIEKARAFFGIYAKLLADRPLFHLHDRPTSLDVTFAAHTHILTKLPFANPLLQTVLRDSYPSLVAHANTVLSIAFPEAQSLPQAVQPSMDISFSSLIPWPRHSAPKPKTSAKTDEEVRRFRNLRWAFIGLSVAASVVYLYSMAGLVTIKVVYPERDAEVGEADGLQDVEDEELEEENEEEGPADVE